MDWNIDSYLCSMCAVLYRDMGISKLEKATFTADEKKVTKARAQQGYDDIICCRDGRFGDIRINVDFSNKAKNQ